MGRAGHSLTAALLAAVVLLGASCASTNVNPPSAKAHRGYVDFYSPGQTNLCWKVKAWQPGDSGYKTVFSQFKPLPDGVLRLEMAPGPKRFEITFLNRVVEAPAACQVTVQEGLIIPVKVELKPMADISVRSAQQQVGPNISGAGRKTRYSSQAGTVERVVTTVQPPVPYLPKGQMSYPP